MLSELHIRLNSPAQLYERITFPHLLLHPGSLLIRYITQDMKKIIYSYTILLRITTLNLLEQHTSNHHSFSLSYSLYTKYLPTILTTHIYHRFIYGTCLTTYHYHILHSNHQSSNSILTVSISVQRSIILVPPVRSR